MLKLLLGLEFLRLGGLREGEVVEEGIAAAEDAPHLSIRRQTIDCPHLDTCGNEYTALYSDQLKTRCLAVNQSFGVLNLGCDRGCCR